MCQFHHLGSRTPSTIGFIHVERNSRIAYHVVAVTSIKAMRSGPAMIHVKRDQHTVPRYYLSAFSIPNEPAYIWEYRRGVSFNPGPPGRGRNPVKRALKKASVKIDYYGRFEDDLAKHEEEAKPVLGKLRELRANTTQPALTSVEKSTFADYIGLFMKRTTSRERRLPAVWSAARPQVIINLETTITGLMNEGRFGDARKLRDEMKKYEGGLPDEIRQQSTLEPFKAVRARIIEFTWTFLTSEAGLVTSDNPVSFPEREGLGHDQAFLTLPIGPSVALVAGTDAAAAFFDLPATPDLRACVATEQQVAVINHLTISNADNYVYSHLADESIAMSLG